MADIDHKDIPDADLHEPKGVADASVNEVYVTDGAGSGTWSIPDPGTNVHAVMAWFYRVGEAHDVIIFPYPGGQSTLIGFCLFNEGDFKVSGGNHTFRYRKTGGTDVGWGDAIVGSSLSEGVTNGLNTIGTQWALGGGEEIFQPDDTLEIQLTVVPSSGLDNQTFVAVAAFEY